MLSKQAYDILMALKMQGGGWSAGELAALAKRKPRSVLPCVLGLIRRELIERRGSGYYLTPDGEDEIARSYDDPWMTTNARAWINRVRAGIDGNGRQTKVERAAIPDHVDSPSSYRPDLEEAIDVLDREIRPYLTEDDNGSR